MKVSSGSVIIRKPIEQVFKYTCDLSNFNETSKIYSLEDYDLETDDDVDGVLSVGEIFSIYAYTKYEEGEDFVLDIEVTKLSENDYIVFAIDNFSVYVNEEDTKSIPISSIWEKIEFGMIFTESNGHTQVQLLNYVKPSAGLVFKLMFIIFNSLGFSKNRKLLNQWAAIVENNA